MVLTQTGPDASLAELLSARARAATASRLFLDIGGGVAIAAVTLWARPAAWGVVLSAALCFCCYGLWAFAERRLGAEPWHMPALAEQAWRACRGMAAVLGMTAFIALLLSVLGLGLGTWIS